MRTTLLAITALALFLIGATAPAAPAQPAFNISAPGKVRGEQRDSDNFVVHGVRTDCERVLVKGGLEKKSTTLALSSEYYECIASVLSGLPSDFFTDYACDYVLRGLRRTDEAAQWKADVDLSCPGNYPGFALEIFETVELLQVCSIWIPEQPDAGTATLRNLGGPRGGIEVRWELRELEYEVITPGGGSSSLLCGSSPTSTPTDTAHTEATKVFAHDRSGNPLDLWLTG